MSVVPLPAEKRIKSQAIIDSVKKSYCEYCSAEASGELHHIRPRSQGRTGFPANLIELKHAAYQR